LRVFGRGFGFGHDFIEIRNVNVLSRLAVAGLKSSACINPP
jgi:hypothetical protein